MDVKNTAASALPLQPIVGAHGFWRRLDVRMGGVQVESISQMNRCQELFLMLSSSQARRKELFMSGGTISSESVDANFRQIPDPIAQGQTKNMSMSILSGLTAQSKFLWPNAAPIEFTFELDDATANLHVPVVADAETTSSSFQIENMYITAEVIEMDSALLNKYVEHLSEGKSLSWENKTLNSVLHSVGSSNANFSCNQSRAYTKLDTIFVNYIRTELQGTGATTPYTSRKQVNWFQGLTDSSTTAIDDTNDILEAYITIGSKRVPLFAETKLNQH
jgi:hypothetical protein